MQNRDKIKYIIGLHFQSVLPFHLFCLTEIYSICMQTGITQRNYHYKVPSRTLPPPILHIVLLSEIFLL